MEIDLQDLDVSGGPLHAQVCIIGAGIAGLVLAQRLCQQGISVALLEAGGLSLNEVRQNVAPAVVLKGRPHRGTSEGRFHVFGGSSLRWGGQLLPMTIKLSAAWPVTSEELAPYISEAEQILGVNDLPYRGEDFFTDMEQKAPALLDALPGMDVVLSKWVPFTRRNLAETLGRRMRADKHVTVYLKAQVTELLPDASGTRIQAVLAHNPGGQSFRFEAEQFVIAAGTVETARLLLVSRSVSPDGVGNAHGQVGRNFHDHLTLPIATAAGEARNRLLQDLRPWVVGGTLHSVKFAADADLSARLGLNPVLVHLAMDEPEDSAMGLVRHMLLSRQLGSPRIGGVSRFFRAVVEAVRLAWSAKVGGRRFVSKNARVRLYLNATQDSPSISRIALSGQTDAYGMPEAEVEWQITQNELETLRKFATYLKEQLGAALDGMQWSKELDEGSVPKGLDDARHAMGGACMGEDPRSSVVGADLSVHGVANLSIASAAVFPDGSPQLPTLPLLALTLRLADRLATVLLQ
jgi:choline dehydrogenase-like flavoprotein